MVLILRGPMDLNLLTLFVAVAESGTFSAAARRLGVPKSSVSRGVAALEKELGAWLLHRTTRHVSLSTAGEVLYAKAGPLLASLREALGSLPEQASQPTGELRLTAPGDMGAAFLAEVISRFTARFPGLRVDARLTGQNVDLVAEGLDLALRASTGSLADSSLIARKLSPLEFQVFASPTYLARRGTPRSVEEAHGHDWVALRGLRLSSALGVPRERVRVVGDDMVFVREAVRAGAGMALLPTFLVQSEVAAGELVRVLPRYAERKGSLFLVYPKARHVPPKVTAFRDFLIEYLAARPLAARVD